MATFITTQDALLKVFLPTADHAPDKAFVFTFILTSRFVAFISACNVDKTHADC